MIANTSMDADKIKIFGARVRMENTLTGVAQVEAKEKEKMKKKVDKIKAYGINVFINRQLIYNYPEQLFAEANIMAIEHADFDGVERLSKVTNCDITSTFDHPEDYKMGTCDCIEEVMIGEDRLLRLSGGLTKGACTIVLRGASVHVLDEAERSLHDALAVLSQTVREPRVTYGGGCAEMLMAKAVDDMGKNVEGKKKLAIHAFARALRTLPHIIADNGGFDASELVSVLEVAHNKGESTAGLDMTNGTKGDMASIGILESYRAKAGVLMSAAEASEAILRTDEIIRAAPRRREQ